MITSVEIAWIAGLIEGEGTLRMETSPRITIKMTDEDVIDKARNLMAPKNIIRIESPNGRMKKTAYILNVQGNLAIQWMMTIYSLMGRRRKEKIREVILGWENQEWSKGMSEEVRQDNHAVKLIAMSRKISMSEARKIYHEVIKVN